MSRTNKIIVILTIVFVSAVTFAQDEKTISTSEDLQSEIKIQRAEAALRLLGDVRAQEERDQVPVEHRSRIDFAQTPGCKTVLILNGLYESPFYTSGLSSYFLSQGYDVVNLLSSAHFRPADPRMLNLNYTDWKQDARKGLEIAKALGNNVFVLGYSTGGLMAADLALHFPNEISGLFLFAPALKLSATTEAMVTVGSLINFYPAESCNKDKISLFCKLISIMAAGSVKNAKPLIKEGLSWSPDAGLQVKLYVEAILNEYDPNPQSKNEGEGSSENTYHKLADIYSLITAPLFMVTTKGDLTTNAAFSKLVYRKINAPKHLIEYRTKDDIAHTNITKYAENAYRHSQNFYNKHTFTLEDELNKFVGRLGLTCRGQD